MKHLLTQMDWYVQSVNEQQKVYYNGCPLLSLNHSVSSMLKLISPVLTVVHEAPAISYPPTSWTELNWTSFSPISQTKLLSVPSHVCFLLFLSRILLKIWLIGNRTSCRPIRSVIMLVIKQIGLPLRGRPILLITHMVTDRIGLHSVLLPLLIIPITKFSNLIGYHQLWFILVIGLSGVQFGL